jgi:hypothetical protein
MRIILGGISGALVLLSAGAIAEVNRLQSDAARETLAPMVLNGYSQFPPNIGSAPVYDLQSHRVGLIQKLNADATGKPASILVWFPTGRSVTVSASNISYDEQQNTITAGLTDAEAGFVSRSEVH